MPTGKCGVVEVAGSCYGCLNKLTLKAGQCETCGSAPLYVMNQADVLPLQFLNWAAGAFSLPQLVESARAGNTQIEFGPIAESDAELRELLNDFADARSAYLRFVQAQTGDPASRLKVPMGLASAEDHAAEQTKIERLRSFAFVPVIDAVSKKRSGFAPLEMEMSYLEPFLILKNDLRLKFNHLLTSEAFAQICSSTSRERLQTHFDFSHPEILKYLQAHVDECSPLRALARWGYLEGVRDLATVILFMRTGENQRAYLDVTERLGLARETVTEEIRNNEIVAIRSPTNPNGYVRPITLTISLECALQSLGWRSFYRDQETEPSRPVRALLHLESIRKTLQPLAGQNTEIDLITTTLKLESAEPITPEELADLDRRATNDVEFALLRSLVARPIDKVRVESIVQADERFRDIAWIVGINRTRYDLPDLKAPAFDEGEVEAMNKLVGKMTRKIMENRLPLLSDASIASIEQNILSSTGKAASWEQPKLPVGLQNNLLDLLIFHSTNQKTVAEAVVRLGGDSRLFWLRPEIEVTHELYAALGTDDSRRARFFWAAAAAENVTPRVLVFESSVLRDYYAWNAGSGKSLDDVSRLLDYLERVVPSSRDALLSEEILITWLNRFAAKPEISANVALATLVRLTTAHRNSFPDARPLGEALGGSGNGWGEGLRWFFVAQVGRRIKGPDALQLKEIVEREKLLVALDAAIGHEAFFQLVLEELGRIELYDKQNLFEMFFRSIESEIPAKSSPTCIRKLHACWRAARELDNQEISSLLAGFLSAYPDPDKLEAEEKAKQAATDLAAAQAPTKAKANAIAEMMAKLDAEYEANMKVLNEGIQKQMSAASQALSAAFAADPATAAAAQEKFASELSRIQNESRSKAKAMIDANLQAREMLRKLAS